MNAGAPARRGGISTTAVDGYGLPAALAERLPVVVTDRAEISGGEVKLVVGLGKVNAFVPEGTGGSAAATSVPRRQHVR